MSAQIDRFNGTLTGLAIKAPCKVVATSPVSLSGLASIGGVAIVAGDRILVLAQADLKQNGIYTASSSGWVRAADFDGNRDVTQGTLVTVSRGDSSSAMYELVTENPVSIGTSNLVFRQVYDRNISIGITPQEEAVDITYINDAYAPGDLFRYAANPATDMVEGITAAVAQSKQDGGAPVTGFDGSYTLDATVDFRGAFVSMPETQLLIGHANGGIICGGWSSRGNNKAQWFGEIRRTVGTASSTSPDVKIIGGKGQRVTVERAGWVQIYADTSTLENDGGSSAYSFFDIKYCDTLEFKSNGGTDGSLTQWINENRIRLGRCKNFIMDGTYSHNHNIIDGGCFEDDTGLINIVRGTSNHFPHLRLESGPDIQFGTRALRNRLIQSWISSDSDLLSEALHASAVIDNGYDNMAVKQISLDRQTHILASASVDDIVLNDQVMQSGRRPSLSAVNGASGGIVLETRRFRVYKNDIVGFYTEKTNAMADPGYRLRAFFYDEDGVLITPVLATQNTYPPNGNYYSVQVNNPQADYATASGLHDEEKLQIRDSAIAWCRLEVRTVSGYADRECARQLFIYLRRLSGSPLTAIRNAHADIGVYQVSGHPVSATPTQGYAPLGYMANSTTGLGAFVVTKSVDTTLASSASAGATSIVLANTTGIAAGDIIGIMNDDCSVTDWRTVNSAAGAPTITLTGGGLTGVCTTGNRVVFLKWTAVTY